MTRRRGKVDANQRAIVEALRKTGWLVLSLADVGDGCPDLLAYREPKWQNPTAPEVRLIEVKVPKGQLTAAQVKFRSEGWPVTVIRTVEEVLAL